jgi:hypothetical protein
MNAVVDAFQGIVAAFQKHPVVILGEDHWLRQAGDFYIHMVRNRAFQETVQDIVVEFASRNNQSLRDRYIAGEDVPIAESGVTRPRWRAGNRPFTRNGSPRSAMSTSSSRLVIASTCWPETRQSIGATFGLTLTRRPLAITTRLLLMSSLNRSFRSVVARWS